MTLALIAFTAQGYALGEGLAGGLRAWGDAVCLTRGFGPDKPASLREWTRQAMEHSEGIVFIGATGIAVRSVAPHLKGKQADPAVVVLDERGRFSIALVSGHVGGANRLALAVAQLTGSQPVITTATDGRGLFAVDVWAKEQGLALLDPEAAKAVSAALLDGRDVAVLSDLPLRGGLPKGLQEGGEGPVGIYVGVDRRLRPFGTTLQALPRALVLGVGCRKGIARQALEERIDAALANLGSPRQAVAAVHSLDRKAGEEALVALCEDEGWPLRTFSAETLAGLPGDFTPSPRVLEHVGVDNVCERAAVAQGGRLLLRKQAQDGVTVAVALLPKTITFEEA